MKKVENSPIVCVHCVLDNRGTKIKFDENGVCNYCNDFLLKKKTRYSASSPKLGPFIGLLKKEKGKYNCIAAISGGLDSCYMLYLLKKSGLNPLAVHCDMGWSTETAVANIYNLVKKLDVDLYTDAIDWEEFKDVQLSYLRAGVLDLEMPTDHAYTASLYRAASKFNIKYIISGINYATESIMPENWVYNKGDAANLKDIHKKYGSKKNLKSFPVLSLSKKFYYFNIKRIQSVSLLNLIEYNKAVAMEILKREIDWKPYPMKHGEAIFTRFYQCHILPFRFEIDKRKAHLSNLICSKQISRENALAELEKPIYDEEMYINDRKYVSKKLGLTDEELQMFLTQKIRGHQEFKSEVQLKIIYHRLRTAFPFLKKIFRVSEHF